MGRRQRRSATKSRSSNSDKHARRFTRTPVKLSTNRCAANSTDRSRNLTQRQSAVVSKRRTVSLGGRRTVPKKTCGGGSGSAPERQTSSGGGGYSSGSSSNELVFTGALGAPTLAPMLRAPLKLGLAVMPSTLVK